MQDGGRRLQGPGEARAAVAANFADTAEALARLFARGGGGRVAVTPGPSGPLAAQILRGAPFDLFLSADVERARMVERGAGVAGSVFVYATGRLVLYSRDRGRVDGQGRVLREPRLFAKLAIADPAAAPYGAAAIQTLQRLGLYEALRPRIVQGASIAQAFQFVQTGAAELGFVALSQVVDRRGGSMWLVPETLHAPLTQAAVLTRQGEANAAARAFLAFLRGGEARRVIARSGYRAD